MDKGHTQAFNAYLKLHKIATFTVSYVRSKVSSVPVFKRAVNIVRTPNFHFNAENSPTLFMAYFALANGYYDFAFLRVKRQLFAF